MKPEGSDQEHIGDGVYVSNDGYQLRLEVPATASSTGTEQVIYLAPQVFEELVRYEERMMCD